jgi:hypothetical protein
MDQVDEKLRQARIVLREAIDLHSELGVNASPEFLTDAIEQLIEAKLAWYGIQAPM